MDKKIIKLQQYLKDSGFEKEAMLLSAIAFLNLFGCAGQEYTMENVNDENLDGMRVPDCIGNIFFPYNSQDFINSGIPLDEFKSQHESLHKVDVEIHDEGRAALGSNLSSYGVDRYCVVIYRNIPVNHPSIESSRIIDHLYPNSPGYWRKSWTHVSTGENLYIRDIYLYYPILSVNGEDMVFFNAQHARYHASGEDEFSSWSERFLDIVIGAEPYSEEDSECRKLIKDYIENSPLRDPEAEY